MAKDNNLQDFLTDVANAIREKKGTSELINPQDFSKEIISLAGGNDVDIMKIVDLTDINLNGGALATDEEYETAYAQFQVLANKTINGGLNG